VVILGGQPRKAKKSTFSPLKIQNYSLSHGPRFVFAPARAHNAHKVSGKMSDQVQKLSNKHYTLVLPPLKSAEC
jgi:hypothetical protein